MLTLSQTGSLFKPRKAYLPQELLGKVRSLDSLFSLRRSFCLKNSDLVADSEETHIA